MSLNPAALLLEQFDHLLTTPEAVEELNRAILTLAVQGKLVQQNPQDESGVVLLKRINEKSKAELQHQDRNLPKGWIRCRFSDVAEVLRGVSYEKSQAQKTPGDGLLPILRANNIRNELNFDDLVYVPTHFISSEQKLREQDIVVCMSSGSASLVGKAAILRTPFEGSFGAFCAVLRSKPNELAEYLNLYLQSPPCKDLFTKTGRGIGINNLRVSDLLNSPLELPPLAEQKRIVARVEVLFAQTRQLAERLARAQHDLTQINQSALAHLLAAETPEEFARQWAFIAQNFDSLFTEPEHTPPLRQDILELAVRGKLTRRESTDEPASVLLAHIQAEKAKVGKVKSLPPVKASEQPFDLPEGWEWARLKQITTTLQTGPFGSNLHKSDYISNGIPVVNPVNMRNGKIIPLGEMMVSEKTRERLSQYILNTGDLVLARRGEIGRCALVTEQEDGWLCGTGSLRLKLAEIISKQFIILLFQTDFARSRLTKETVGITMSNMSQAALENLIFALPPLAEQKRIVAKVEHLLGLCDALETKLRLAREERFRLTAAVLAGVGNGAGGNLKNWTR